MPLFRTSPFCLSAAGGFPRSSLWLWPGFFLLLLCAHGSTLCTNYQVDVWQREDGLPQNSVTSIKQTADGYLWLGT